MHYMMTCKAQVKAKKGAAEVIDGLEEIVIKMIKSYVMATGYKPRKIFFFRDGVGDGQFQEVIIQM
jgi:eukaryotic translation initiation factor 2C